MATKYKEMVKGVTLTASAVSYYTAPDLTSASIHAASANNPGGSPVTINVYKVPSGTSAGSATRIASKTVPAGLTAQFPELVNHKLEPGTQIFADGNGCSLNISGIEYVAE
ncbi:hypothetical protein IAG25_35600 [Caballeronia sp. EK]|uniref:hypothetical protein n=1 Tax=Caballeronia sp. EK TaxID=2767469 RepID=UPI001654D1A0|nr:hypothetical protein [Caballeronia sp. EK]MBC8642133.1 hypothetical protein [Caballeronia sp. EK]